MIKTYKLEINLEYVSHRAKKPRKKIFNCIATNSEKHVRNNLLFLMKKKLDVKS